MSLARLSWLGALGGLWGCTGKEPTSPDTPLLPTDTIGNTTTPIDTNTTGNTTGPTTGGTTTTNCSYPSGAVEPMALGEVISPYRWPNAIHRDGRQADIDLAQIPCAEDPDIDWSPHDVLVFVSIPAW